MSAPAMLGTIRERVEAGAAWLDLHRPRWWQRTHLDRLSMRHSCRCVLGQEFGDFYAVKTLALDEAVALGFDVSGAAHVLDPDRLDDQMGAMDAEFTALDEAWAALIEQRRADWSDAA